MAERRNWDWDETLRAFALYFAIPSGQHHRRNHKVIELAEAIGRSPSAVARKLGNIKAYDPMSRGKGLPHTSKLDLQVWEEYQQRGDALMEEALGLLLGGSAKEDIQPVDIEYMSHDVPEGRDRIVVATARANQAYFRNALLDNYDRRCCISGLAVEPLLVASHIKPWSAADPVTERLSPENGLLLDALHDKAFDRGLLTIDNSLRIVISPKVPKPWEKRGGERGDYPEWSMLWSYAGRRISVPGRFKPRREFIEYHNDVVFQR